MKHLIVTVCAFLTITNVFCQDYSHLKDIPLTNTQECKNAEEKVIECSDYLFKTPCKEDISSLYIMQFIIAWMGATPDYSFGFDSNFYTATKSDLSLNGRYLAAMCKYAIENYYTKADKTLQTEAIKTVLTYCKIETNEVKISKKLKKYIESYETGTLNNLISE